MCHRRCARVKLPARTLAATLSCLWLLPASADTRPSQIAALDPTRQLANTTRMALASPTAAAGSDAGVMGSFLWLEVSLNGHAVPGLVEVEQLENDLSIARKDWQNMGLQFAPSELGSNDRLRLAAMPNVSVQLDSESQRLLLTLPSERFKHQQVSLNGTPARLPDATPFNAVLNYDVFVQHARPPFASGDSTEFAGLFDARMAGQWGSVNQSLISQVPTTGGQSSVRRLDSSYKYFDPVSLTSWQVGDAISRGLVSRPAIRFGGVQWQRNFSLRPDLITFPTPSVSGSSAVPTAVDVYVDQIRRSQMDLPAGPFTLNQLPVLTGPHQVQVVVRDALGREQVTTLDLFASPFLLSPGLLDFAVQAGVSRRNYAQEDDRYGDDVLTIGSLRYGLTEALTLETQAELTRDFGLFAGGVAGLVGRRGSYGLTLATSQFDGLSGHELNGRFDYYLQRNFIINGSFTEATNDFRDISSIESDSLPVRSRQQLAISKGFDRGTTLAASWLRQETFDDDVFSSLMLTAARNVLEHGYLSVSGWQSLEGEKNWGLSVGLSWFLGNRRSVSAFQEFTSNGSSTVLGAQSNLAQDPGWGWRVDVAEGQREYRRAEVLNRNHYNDVSVMVEDGQSGSIGRAGVVGALAWMPGTLQAGRRINDAYALVDLGFPDVAVFLENRPIGRTDSDGFLLVNDLNAYQQNKLSLQALDLPLDVTVGDAERQVVPARESGVRVGFDLARNQESLLALRHTNGRWLALGSLLLLPGEEPRVVGHDGQVLVPASFAGQSLLLQSEFANCRAQLPDALEASQQGVTVVEVLCQ